MSAMLPFPSSTSATPAVAVWARVVIQPILRHANLSTTTGYYIKSAADDLRDAMAKRENSIPKPELDTNWTPTSGSAQPI